MHRAPLLSIALLFALLPAAQAQTVHFAEGFESGLANWTATGLWNLESDSDPCGAGATPFPEGARCAYYGIDGVCHYDTGAPNAGTLTLNAPLLVPTGAPAIELHWWARADVEPCDASSFGYDDLRLEVSTNAGQSWIAMAHSCLESGPHSGSTSPGLWLPQRASLNFFAGQSILLRFRFDTFDANFNGTRGFLIDDLVLRTEAGTAFCTQPCPCLVPFPGSFVGCRNSARRFGELAGGGTTSVAADTVVLTASDLAAPGVAVFLQSTTSNPNGSAFGDGRFCLTGSQIRLGTKAVPGGVASYPGAGDPALSLVGQLPAAGGTRNYQVVYRDAQAWCDPASFNATNAYRIVWAP